MGVEAERIEPQLLTEARYQTWNNYNHLAAKNGTLEAEFLAYGKFMQSFRGYIHQLGASSISSEDKNFVQAIVFEHERLPIQLDFLQTAKEQILDKVFDGDSYYLSYEERWPKALRLLSDLTEREYQRTVMTLGQEVEARQALELMVGQRETPEGALKILEDREQRSRVIQRHAVRLMTSGKGIFPSPIQEDLAQDVSKLDKLVGALISLSQEPAFDTVALNERLSPYDDLLKIGEEDSWARQLSLRASLGQHEEIKQILKTLLDERSEINKGESEKAGREIRDTRLEFMWHYWEQKGLVPESLIQSFDELLVLTQLADISRKLHNASRVEKACSLTPFLRKGVSALVIKDVVEGKVAFDENYFTRQVEAMMPLLEEQAEKKGIKHLGRKLVAAVVLATVLSLATPMTESNSNLPDQVAALMSEIPKDQIDVLKGIDENMVGPIEGEVDEEENGSQSAGEGQPGSGVVNPGGTGALGSSGSGEGSAQEKGQQESDDNFFRPRNDSAEALSQELEEVAWSIDGKDSRGYYITERASRWDVKKRGWVVDTETVSYIPTSAGFRDLTLSKKTVLASTKFKLPTKSDYTPIVNSETTFIADAKTGVALQLFRDFNVVQRADGSYYLTFSPQWRGKEIEIKFSFIKNNSIPAPSATELQNMRTKIVDIRDLPADVQNFALQMIGSELSQGERAKLWEQFIKNNFWYSLNQSANSYYYEARTNKEFFQRIFELRKTDCDLANTALVAVLRSQGIASRLVVGYANVPGPFNLSDQTLAGAEGHGWVEAYIGGKWIALDATPIKLDDETREQLKSKLTPSQMQGFEQQEKNKGRLGNAQDKAGLESGDKNDAEDKIGFLPGGKEGYFDSSLFILPVVYLLNYGLYKMSNLIRKRNKERIQSLKSELLNRARVYTGGNQAMAEVLVKPGLERLSGYETGRTSRQTLLVPGLAGVSLIDSIKEMILAGKHPLNQINNDIPASSSPNAVEFYTKVVGGLEAEVLEGLYLAGYRQARARLRDARTDFRNTFRGTNSWPGDMAWEWFAKAVEVPLHKFQFSLNPAISLQKREQLKEQVYKNYAVEFEKRMVKEEKKKRKMKKDFSRSEPISREDFDRFLDSMLDIELAGEQVKVAYQQAQASIPRPLSGLKEKIKRTGKKVWSS